MTGFAATFLIFVATIACVTVLLAVFKWLINNSKRKQCEDLRRLYQSYIKGEEDEETLQREKYKLLRLFDQAGVRDTGVSSSPPSGSLGRPSHSVRYDPGPLSVFDLFPTRREDLVPLVNGKLSQASGTYLSRMQDASNPLYWIESITYLPRNVATYFDISPQGLATKVLTVLYWILWFVSSLLFAIVGSDLFLEWAIDYFRAWDFFRVGG